jgi:hypothetical protein
VRLGGRQRGVGVSKFCIVADTNRDRSIRHRQNFIQQKLQSQITLRDHNEFSTSDGQPAHNLLRHRVRPRGDLLRRLVLDGMRDVDGVKACAAQRAGLYASRGHELRGSYRHGRDAQVLQLDRVVQTARGARPSIRQAFHHGVQRA